MQKHLGAGIRGQVFAGGTHQDDGDVARGGGDEVVLEPVELRALGALAAIDSAARVPAASGISLPAPRESTLVRGSARSSGWRAKGLEQYQQIQDTYGPVSICFDIERMVRLAADDLCVLEVSI